MPGRFPPVRRLSPRGDAATKAKILAALDEMQRMTRDALAFIREDIQGEETRTADLHALVDSAAADLAELGHDIEVADSGPGARRLPAGGAAPGVVQPAGERSRLRGRARMQIERDAEEFREVRFIVGKRRPVFRVDGHKVDILQGENVLILGGPTKPPVTAA